MQPETRQNLTDAKAAAEEVLLIAESGWWESRTVALAIERLLMILGEALVRIRASEESVLSKVSDAHKVIGMRNVLVHGYDAIDSARLQDAIDHNLPKLIAEIDTLLGS